MNHEPVVDVVIAVHDVSRPIRRAVSSVLDGSGLARVTVVCHGIAAAAVAEKLDGLDTAAIRVLEFSDGIRSPAGPFNFGLAQATAPYVAVMGSDDFLEPGAMAAWIRGAERTGADAAIARLRHQGGRVLHNPLVRWRRSQRLDPVRDRLFYRTAPLGLLRRATIDSLELRFDEGLLSGEDLAFSAKLWTSGARIDLMRDAPCYVIGGDATVRASTQPMTLDEGFRAIRGLLGRAWVSGLSPALRRSLAIKLIRVHVLGAVLARRTAESWSDGDLAELVQTVRRILSLSPGALAPLARADRDLLRAVSEPGVTPPSIAAAVAKHTAAGRLSRLVPRNPLCVFDREGSFIRYLLYRLDPVGR